MLHQPYCIEGGTSSPFPLDFTASLPHTSSRSPKQGLSPRSVQTRGTDPPRYVLHSTATPERACLPGTIAAPYQQQEYKGSSALALDRSGAGMVEGGCVRYRQNKILTLISLQANQIYDPRQPLSLCIERWCFVTF